MPRAINLYGYRLEPVEPWRHALFENSMLVGVPDRDEHAIATGRPWRPTRGYAAIDRERRRTVGLVVHATKGIQIRLPPAVVGGPDRFDLLPASRLWLPVLASCEPRPACISLSFALYALAKADGPETDHRPGPPPVGEDLDAMAGLV